MIVAQTRDGTAVTAKDLKADGAMAVLLKDALAPNLVQTLEGSPAFVHGGPFANIAHGCNSVMATRLGAEAGRRGGDRGRLRRRSGRGEVHRHQVPLGRAEAVLRRGGGDGARAEDAWRRGAQRAGRGECRRRCSAASPTSRGTWRTWANSACRWWWRVNHFTSDTEAEFAAIRDAMAKLGVEAISCTHWARWQRGRRGAGARGAAEDRRWARRSPRRCIPTGMQLADKIRTIAQEIYRAADIAVPDAVARRLEGFEKAGFGHVPVCIAKTQYSFTADPTVMGAPEGFTSAGARGAAVRRRRLRGGDLRRHHDDARPAARAVGRGDPPARGRRDRRAVLANGACHTTMSLRVTGAAKQSICDAWLDCFVAAPLAMTARWTSGVHSPTRDRSARRAGR